MTSSGGSVLAGSSPEAIHLYRSLLAAIRPLGEFGEDVKKTSVHLTRKSTFAGVHFRRSYLILVIKTISPIDSARIVKVEQVSKKRWHCELKVASESEIDVELRSWIGQAYEICA